MEDIDPEIEEYMKKFDMLVKEMRELKRRKTYDYGLDIEREAGYVGLYGDLSGKMARLRRLVIENREPKVKDETIRDTYLDLAVYALMSLKAYDEGNPGKIFRR